MPLWFVEQIFFRWEGNNLYKRQHHKVFTARILELSSELPMVVTLIDTADAIAVFLPLVKEMVAGGLVIQETVNLVHHAPRSSSIHG